ncbi:hypothetical protein CHX26_01105 [Porphyrobacter sp. HT-58-2]|uniref:hypothetical protein n=1 Tax=Porphyrobacter sp. HT-58-2 TaxID=2023229 RepID=UPI000CDBD22E|nr:hypothetical protein [Porphyrobacter sp. HT-58-2]AUX68300.1 hypothetical protein CHX26_01105 [Porphyrobacter sp. HT-58-2]
MNAFRKILSLAAAMTCLACVTTPLAAQESATVDALANLVQADQPLTLTGIAPLNFGQVAIPRVGNVTCTYDLRSDGNRTLVEGSIDQGAGPSPAGCAYRDDRTDRARLTLRCETDRQVEIAVRSQSAGVQGTAVLFETFENYIEVDGQERFAWDRRCTGEEMVVRVGGQLVVQGEARPTDGEIVVGAIILEAFYP